MKLKKYQKIALLTVGTIVVIILFFTMMIIQKNGDNSFNGVLQALQFLGCLILVMIDTKKGRIISNVILGISLMGMARDVILFKHMAPIPGICNSIIYIAVLNMLGHLLAKQQMKTVTDFLTGLVNRRGLYDYLSEHTTYKHPFYVVYFDLDNFKMINDNQGHRYGDIVLKEVASRMTSVIDNKGSVFRVSGDEFVAIIPNKDDPEFIANEVIAAVNEKYNIIIDGRLIESYLNVYAGISKYPEDSTNPDDLLKFADIAMYAAAKNKIKKVSFFDKQMAQILLRQLEVEKMIKESFDNDYFYLMYQPQYESNSKKLRGFETLIRMEYPDGTSVSPGEFIPVAEKSDLILRIDDYVIARAMREFKQCITKNNPNIMLSINISAKNAASNDFARKIEKALENNNFPAKNLEIEITEYCLLQSLDDTIANINYLRRLGVQVALDDFGTGYTSLSYLAKLPINLLKLDKCLIDDIDKDKKGAEFVRSVIELGHLMDCDVIAEGVERDEQLFILKEYKCDFIQGFIWSRPLEYSKMQKIT